MKKIFYYETKIGKIAIAEDNNAITDVYFRCEDVAKEDYIESETELLKEAGKQIKEYFNGARKNFSLPLAPVGTDFMRKVWNALVDIPYGETRSYKDIAQKTDSKLAYRAVGLANNKNPIPIIIPCHRVIGANKKLVGYGGGLELKEYLLQLEKQYVGCGKNF